MAAEAIAKVQVGANEVLVGVPFMAGVGLRTFGVDSFWIAIWWTVHIDLDVVIVFCVGQWCVWLGDASSVATLDVGEFTAGDDCESD